MYESYFGLRRNPFSLTADPDLLYMTPSHREALAGLAYGILECKGFIALTGEAGTGKTSLLARTLKYLPTSKVLSSVILNPMLNAAEFIELMMLDFGFQTVPESKAQRLVKFQEFLLYVKNQNQTATLIIDEAHKLEPSVLEEIRLLNNLELPGQKLLQIVMAGQPELNDLLARPDLRQLNQRIAVRLSLQLLREEEVKQYIAVRWTDSGSAMVPFDLDVYREIAIRSKGIPRLVNSICDTALVLAFAERSAAVRMSHILDACRDLRIMDSPVRIMSKKDVAGAAGAAKRPVLAKPQASDGEVFIPMGQIRIFESYQKPKRTFWRRFFSNSRGIA